MAQTAQDHKPGAAEKLLQQFVSNRKWQGCDASIMTSFFGLDAILLAKAMKRYASDPGARQELRPVERLKTGTVQFTR